ncbi:hypothetical protein [Mycetocola zhujimingii]|uniref:hypothetical protein n=1 Tax=Mycetocola zhujimingii TaxID=2079792 RepID=UPI000D3D4D65|nr:hypothetical protein [Mycetocola zhujimingii]AWB87061.1 hypothetical protein C3E77_10840 [Mycetocola zhujimingii]
MKARLIASVALAATVVFGTTGCNLVSPQSTTKEYDPSDGVSVNVGDLRLRNLIVLTDDGIDGNLIVTVVNTGGPHSLSLQYGEDDTTVSTIVDGNVSTVFGGESAPLVLPDIDAEPGSFMPMFVQYGNETGKEVLVPVLDGTIAPYDEFITEASTDE